MKATEILTEIKGVLGIELNQDEQQEKAVELATAKLSNGTEIEAEAFEPGAAVFIVTEDEKIALPEGEYEMEDNKILVVAEEGVIAELKDAAEESEEEAPAEEEVEAEEEVQAYVTKEEFAAAIDEIKAMIDGLGGKDEEEVEAAAEEIEVEAEKVEASQEPQEVELAAEPIAHNPEAEAETFKFSWADNAKTSKANRIKSILNKL